MIKDYININLEYSVEISNSVYSYRSQHHKLSFLDSKTIAIAKENSVVIMAKDRSSAYEVQLPGSFTIGGITKNHDFSGSDSFFVFGKDGSSPQLVKIKNYDTSPVDGTFYGKCFYKSLNRFLLILNFTSQLNSYSISFRNKVCG